MGSAMLSARQRGSRWSCAGNEVPMIRVQARRLANVYVDPFTSAVWDGAPPLDRDHVLALAQAGDGLPPGPECMGGDLETLEQHSARVAWLMRQTQTWAPLDGSTALYAEGAIAFGLADGHHRLAAAILLDRHVDIALSAGAREVAEQLLQATGGEWVEPPQGEVFGEGVFPGRDGVIHAYGMHRKCWVERLATAECLGQFGPQVWRVAEEGDMYARHAVRRESSFEDFLAEFGEVVDQVLGMGDGALSGYLRCFAMPEG